MYSFKFCLLIALPSLCDTSPNEAYLQSSNGNMCYQYLYNKNLLRTSIKTFNSQFINPGLKMRDQFKKQVDLYNEAANLNGFKDASYMKVIEYESNTFQV